MSSTGGRWIGAPPPPSEVSDSGPPSADRAQPPATPTPGAPTAETLSEMEETVSALRRELAARDESIFDLQVSLQAVEAEKAHEIRTAEEPLRREISSLQESLRRAVHEANVARRMAAASASAAGERSPSAAATAQPSHRFPPPFARGPLQQRADAKTAAAAGAATSPVAAAPAAPDDSGDPGPRAGALPLDNDSSPAAAQAKFWPKQRRHQQLARLQQQWESDGGDDGGGPWLAGTILEVLAVGSLDRSGEAGSDVGGTIVGDESLTDQEYGSRSNLRHLPPPMAQTLVRWRNCRAPTEVQASKLVSGWEVILYCVEQVVLASRDSSGCEGESDGAPPSSIALVWHVLELALVLASPFVRRNLANRIGAAASGAMGRRAPSGIAAVMDVDRHRPDEASAMRVNHDDDGSAHQRSARQRSMPSATELLFDPSLGGRTQRTRRTCIRSLKTSCSGGEDRLLFAAEAPVEAGNASGGLPRWELSLLEIFLPILQRAVSSWSEPHVSGPASRVLHHLLLAAASTGRRGTASADAAMSLLDPTWLWPLSSIPSFDHKRTTQCLLDSWERAATASIQCHQHLQEQRKDRCEVQSHSPYRQRLTGAPPGPKVRDGQGIDDGAGELALAPLLQWMAATLRLFSATSATLSAEYPPPRAAETCAASGGGSSGNSDDKYGGDSVIAYDKGDRPPSQLLPFRRLLANVLDVLELVVLPLLESSPPCSRSMKSSDRSCESPVSDAVLMGLATHCVSFFASLARLDPPCPTASDSLNGPSAAPRVKTRGASKGQASSTSSIAEALGVATSPLVLLRVEMPTTRSTATTWDRAPSAIAVATGLMHVTAVRREERRMSDWKNTKENEEDYERELILSLVRFFHQIMLKVQLDRRWKTARRVPSTKNNSEPGVSFRHLVSQCLHSFATAAALLRYATPSSVKVAWGTSPGEDSNSERGERSFTVDDHDGEEDDMRYMLRLQMEVLADEDDI